MRRADLAMGGALAAAVAWATLLPGADLAVAAWFFDPASGQFPLGQQPLLYAGYRAVSLAAPVLLGALVLLLLASWLPRPAWARRLRWPAAFLLASLLIGPGVLTHNVLKDHWGRARPHQIVEFGGTRHFTPALQPAHECARNCAFASGHAAFAFFSMAFAFVLPSRLRRRALVAGFLFGAYIGFVRLAQGGHFLSDVIFSFFTGFGPAWLLYRGYFERRLAVPIAVPPAPTFAR